MRDLTQNVGNVLTIQHQTCVDEIFKCTIFAGYGGVIFFYRCSTTCRVANYILSKPQRNEMNRQYCEGRLSGMNALTAQRFISVQSHEPR